MFHSVNVKALARTALCLGSVLSVAHAFDLGRGRIETTLNARSDYDSNIFANENEVDDFIFTGTGAVNYIRDVALLSTQLGGGVRASAFADHTDQNTVDPFANGRATFTPSDKTTIKGGFNYQRSTVANEALNDRTKSDDVLLDGSLQNLFSEKLGFRLSGDYSSSDFHSPGYSDVYSYMAGLDGVYIYSPKLTVLAGYAYRKSWTMNRPLGAGDPESEDFRYSAGLEGELAPKVTGSLRAGVVNRTFTSSSYSDSTGIFISSGLKWAVDAKTTATLDASRDFDTTAANQSSENFNLTLGASHQLSNRWSVDGSIGYTHSKYQGILVVNDRTDDIYRAKARATYAWASNVSVEFSVGYSDSDSSNVFATYNRVITGVGVTATF